MAEVWFGEHVVTTSFSTIGWRLLRQHFAAKVFVFHPRWKLYCTGLRALSQATLQEWGWPPAPMAPESCLQPLTSVGPGCGSVTNAQQQQQQQQQQRSEFDISQLLGTAGSELDISQLPSTAGGLFDCLV